MLRRLSQWMKRSPSDIDTFKFEAVSSVARAIVRIPLLGRLVLAVCRVIGVTFAALVPAVPTGIASVSLLSRNPIEFYGKVFAYGYPMSVLACFGMNAFMSWRVSTLFGNDPKVLYFSQDFWNIAQYLTVCPAYVCASFCLVATTAMSWSRLSEFIDDGVVHRGRPRLSRSLGAATRVALFLGVSFFASGVFAADFVSQLTELMNDRLYWFFSRTPTGDVTLNTAGGYYLYMNAVLLFVTVMAALCYISMSVEVFRLAHEIRLRAEADGTEGVIGKRSGRSSEGEQRIRRELADFMLCYAWAKVLVLIYAANVLLWQLSPIGKVHNMTVAIFVLAAVGVVFLGFPRLRLASVWHRIKTTHAQTEVRSRKMRSNTSSMFEGFQPDYLKRIQPILDTMFFFLLVGVIENQYGFASTFEFLKYVLSNLVKWAQSF